MLRSPAVWFGFVLALTPWLCGRVLGDFFPECEGKDNLYITSPDSCSRYIFCYGDESFVGKCEDDAPYFSEIEQTCDVRPEVCKSAKPLNSGEDEEDGEVDEEVEGVEEGEEEEEQRPNQPEVEAELPSNVVSEAPMPPVPSQAASSPSPSVMPTTAKPSTSKPIQTSAAVPTSTSSSPKPTTAAPAATSTTATTAVKCPSEDHPTNIVFLQHPKSCSDYFMCYHGEAIPMHCSHTLHFDPITGKCDYPENVQCQLNSVSPREQCQAHTVDYFPHPTNCNYYYLCRFGFLMVMQCPPAMIWDYNRNACVLQGSGNCYKNATKKNNNWNFFLN
ncbi:uncharacterized protein [Musca autumnalis]|uniref:uncharacterized protein n=1 Tax=Musca autumnalis TaxID=221902 RepID=UPI003CF4F427